MNKLLIASPAFNEESTLEQVINKCYATFPEAEVLVVNDCSTDGTLKLLGNLGTRYLSLPFNLGVGGAMRAAFCYAREEDFDMLVQVDADGQHDPSNIKILLEEIDSFDVIIGSRFLLANEYEMEWSRKFAINSVSSFLMLLLKIKITDPTSGFRVSNRRAIELFSETYPIEYLGDTVGSIVQGSMFGLKFGECSTSMYQRQGGQPSQGKIKSIAHLIRTLLSITMIRFRKIPEGRSLT